MNGVGILSSETIYQTEVCWWLIPVCAGIGLLVALGISIWQWIEWGFDGEHIGLIIITTVMCAWIGFLGCMIFEHETDTIDHIEYKVTIDDSVSMNEFLDKYEILDQEGKIYTVKERE